MSRRRPQAGEGQEEGGRGLSTHHELEIGKDQRGPSEGGAGGAVVIGVVLLQGAVHARQVGTCLADSHSRLQSADERKVHVTALVRMLLAVAAEFDEDFRVIQGKRAFDGLLHG